MQAKRTLMHDFECVIKQSDEPDSHEKEYQKDSRPRGKSAINQGSNKPCNDSGKNDDNAAHCRGTALRHMRSRAILTNELSVMVVHQVADEQRGERN